MRAKLVLLAMSLLWVLSQSAPAAEPRDLLADSAWEYSLDGGQTFLR